MDFENQKEINPFDDLTENETDTDTGIKWEEATVTVPGGEKNKKEDVDKKEKKNEIVEKDPVSELMDILIDYHTENNLEKKEKMLEKYGNSDIANGIKNGLIIHESSGNAGWIPFAVNGFEVTFNKIDKGGRFYQEVVDLKDINLMDLNPWLYSLSRYQIKKNKHT